jgi:glycolate oxidase iron-sulfur subunit
MKTTITDNYLGMPLGQEANRILRNCVHCGFCNATCPTYQLLGDELDGPRGRIYLIKNILEGEIPTAKTQLHLDRCLTCRNCETTCPSGVEYSKLLDIGRKLTADKVKRPIRQQLFRFSLRKFLLSSNLFSLSLSIGQLFRPLLPKALRKNIPERASKTVGWPTSKHARKILLVEGCVQSALQPCVQSALQPNIDKAAAITFDRMGIQSLVIKAAGCCGAVSYHLNAEKEAHSYIKRNIDAWWPFVESGSIEAICMTASGCGVMIKDYAHIMVNDAQYADKAKKISALYKDACEIINPEDLPVNKTGTRISFHPPCTLQHGMKLDGKIEPILKRLGYELIDFENKHLCCGSAGTYSITQKELSTQFRDNKLASITTSKPEIIVTANIGCQIHLQSGTNTPIKHWLELLVDDISLN